MEEAGAARDLGDGRAKTPHALVLAHPAGGHLPPAFYVAIELAQRGLLVTFVAFEEAVSRMTSKHEAELRSLELLRFRPIPRPVVDPNDPNYRRVKDSLEQPIKDSKLLEELFTGPEPPTCILASMFYSWSKEMAGEWKVPRYTIFGTGGALPRLAQGVVGAIDKSQVRIRDEKMERFEGLIQIEGLPSLGYYDFPEVLRNVPAVFLKVMQTIVREADGLVINTFHELEPEALDALRRVGTGQKFYAIGPLAPLRDSDATIDRSKVFDEGCFRWLDSQPTESVVYVCFGSEFYLTPGQVKEVGLGLENSKHRFLWVLPEFSTVPGYENAELLPPDYQSRVGERGYVARGWAPQVKLLSHPSVGAFFSHCGWNSSLESISRGMRMIALPITAEQELVRRVLVDKLRIAAEIAWTSAELPDPRIVERAIRVVMEEEDGRAMQDRARALRAIMEATLRPGGASLRERDELLKDLMAL